MPADRILILQPPSPEFLNVMRDYAGGYGGDPETGRLPGGDGRLSTPAGIGFRGAVFDRAP